MIVCMRNVLCMWFVWGAICKKIFNWNTQHQKLRVRVALASEQEFQCHMLQLIPRYNYYHDILTIYHAVYLSYML